MTMTNDIRNFDFSFRNVSYSVDSYGREFPCFYRKASKRDMLNSMKDKMFINKIKYAGWKIANVNKQNSDTEGRMTIIEISGHRDNWVEKKINWNPPFCL